MIFQISASFFSLLAVAAEAEPVEKAGFFEDLLIGFVIVISLFIGLIGGIYLFLFVADLLLRSKTGGDAGGDLMKHLKDFDFTPKETDASEPSEREEMASNKTEGSDDKS